VPAEPRVHAPGDVQVAVDDDAVLLRVTDARVGTDEVEDRPEAFVADERADPLREDRREREALEPRLALVVPPEEERDPEDPRPASVGNSKGRVDGTGRYRTLPPL
jgi:hypothetical protein